MQKKHAYFVSVGSAGDPVRLVGFVDDNTDIPVHFKLVNAKDVLADVNWRVCKRQDLLIEAQDFCR